MSTRATSDALGSALSAIPKEFRKRIIDTYVGVRSAYADGYFDTCGLRAAKFCESLVRFLQNHLTGNHTPFGQGIKSFSDECAKLERLPKSSGHESLRIIIPRALDYLYTLRNKRGVGHVGGDVDANEIDAATALRVADWCVCELLRFFHSMSLEEAQAMLDALAIRQLPEIWSVAGKNRVLESSLDYKSQVLLLLYREIDAGILTEDLFDWVECSQLATFRRDVLRPLHKVRMVEYDEKAETVVISPKGIARVETEILPKLREKRS